MDGQTKDWIRQTIQNEQLTFTNAQSLKLVSLKSYHRTIRSSAQLNCVQGNRGDLGTDNNFYLCKQKILDSNLLN